MFSPLAPLRRYVRRTSGSMLFRRMQAVRPTEPLISFTFDDFPRSALLSGGEILKSYSLRATYYTAIGLMGKGSPSGEVCGLADLRKALDEGNELGCHTFAHLDSWDTLPGDFEGSIVQNGCALDGLIPGAQFRSFSFPLSSPRPTNKRGAARHFSCCRGGGQRFNAGVADLNQLSAYFLEKAKGDFAAVKNLIDQNRTSCGWLIFATHDVAANPSPYGVTPEFFEEVVKYAVRSRSRILPVIEALDMLDRVVAK
jgi:hypothetical protein